MVRTASSGNSAVLSRVAETGVVDLQPPTFRAPFSGLKGNIMIVRKIVLALLLTAVPVIATAQGSTADMYVSATVQASLTSFATHQLRFGTLSMGGDYTLSAVGGTQATLSSATTAGLGQVHVQHNSNVLVTALMPTELRNGINVLAFNATCARASASGGAGTDTGGCASFGLPVSALGTVQSTYVLVGGSVIGDGAAGIGDFSGTISFTFTAVN